MAVQRPCHAQFCKDKPQSDILPLQVIIMLTNGIIEITGGSSNTTSITITISMNSATNIRLPPLIAAANHHGQSESNALSSPLDGRDVAVERRTSMNGDMGVVEVGQNKTMNCARNQNILCRVNSIQTMTCRQPCPQN